MARSKSKTSKLGVVSGTSARTDWLAPENAKFINIYLNDVDQQWLLDNAGEQHEIVAELFEGAAEHAARVSVVPDSRSGRFNATYTVYDVSSVRYGLIMSVRAATPFASLYALAYAVNGKPDAWTVTTTQSGGLFN